MEDGILDNLPNIKGYVLDDGIVEQGMLGGNFTHVRRRYETRRDEVMPDFWDIGQMLGLKVHCVPFIVKLPLPPPVGQDLNDLGVIGLLVEQMKRLRGGGGGDRVKIIKLVDKLRAESTNTPRTRTFLTMWEARLDYNSCTTLIAAGRGG